MDDALDRLQSWKSKHKQEQKEDEMDLDDSNQFEGPETDITSHDKILSQLTPREDLEMKGYIQSSEMLHKVRKSQLVYF